MFSRLFGSQKEPDQKLRFQPPTETADEPAPDVAAPPSGEEESAPAVAWGDVSDVEASSRYVELKVRLHQRLLDLMNLAAIEKMDPTQFRREVGEIVSEIVAKEHIPLNILERQRLVDDIIDEVLGLGPIEPLIKDPTVSDILVNTYNLVFVERSGILERTAVKFKDDAHLLRIIDKIVSTVGRRIDESQPTVDARLPDGSRVNAVIPPVAVDGPLLSIRKFAEIPFDLEKLVSIGTITYEISEVLQAIVRARLNILISGGTGSGKTTTLNAMSRHISNRERIVTIEDAAELQLQQIHVARMETRPPNIEGKGEIIQRDLVKNALRMRPDRIIVGEVRASEAFDMLQAMNTGHEGSMTTIHANSCRDALSRLEQMISMAGLELPMRAMRAQVASAIHVVMQLERLADGRRRLVSLQEITGMESEIITMQEIFKFQQTDVAPDGRVIGDFVTTGIRPEFMGRLEQRGIHLPANLFTKAGVLEGSKETR